MLKLSSCLLALLCAGIGDGSAEATPDDAECWADGLCRFAGCTTPDPDCAPPSRVISLAIRRYTTVTLSDATADSISVQAGAVLQTDSGVNDIACDITFQRSGSVSSFSTGDGSIDTSNEFNTIIGLSGDVKVVNQINWCGFIGSFAGCAPSPGGSFTAIRQSTNSLEGKLWAHEYGHNEGLPDRSGSLVMNGTLSNSNTGLNQTECNAYLY